MHGLHEFRLYKKRLRMDLKEFMWDTMLSRSSKDCGIFDFPVLSRMLDDYAAGRTHVYTEIVAALDLALAQQQFRATFLNSLSLFA
jgi:hypothetical protein